MDIIIIDYETNEPLKLTSGDMAIDRNGNIFKRVGRNLVMDLKTGKLHVTSEWDLKQENRDSL